MPGTARCITEETNGLWITSFPWSFLFFPRLEKQMGVLSVFALLPPLSTIFFLNKMARALQISRWVSVHPYSLLKVLQVQSRPSGTWMWPTGARPNLCRGHSRAVLASWEQHSCLLGGNGTRGLWGLVLGNETLLHAFHKRGDHLKSPCRPAGFVCNMPLFPNYVSPDPLASELLTYRHITKHSRTKQQSTK